MGEGKIDAVQLLRGRFLENFCFSRISFRKVKYLKIIGFGTKQEKFWFLARSSIVRI